MLMVFRQHHSCNVDFTPADVGMDVYPTRHDDLPFNIIGFVYLYMGRRVAGNFAVADVDIPLFAIKAVNRIVYSAAFESDQHAQVTCSACKIRSRTLATQSRWPGINSFKRKDTTLSVRIN